MKRVQHSYGGFSSEFTSDFPQTSALTPTALQQQNFWPHNTIIGSPASALYSTETYMGLSHHDLQQNYCSQRIMNYNQDASCLLGDSSIMLDTSYTYPILSLSENEQLLQLKQNLLGDLDDSNRQRTCLSFDANHDLAVSQSLSASYFSSPNQFGQRPSCNNTGSLSAVSSTKTRIRWTQDLHDRFVDCVNQLGGPDKATPKALHKLMDAEGLTILHVKSHLQKYRNVKYVPESVEGKSEKKSSTNYVAQINIETGMQLKETLQLQLDVQRSLHEQLEIQRNLQFRIEEQGKQLERMLKQHQKPVTLEDPEGSEYDDKLDASAQ